LSDSRAALASASRLLRGLSAEEAWADDSAVEQRPAHPVFRKESELPSGHPLLAAGDLGLAGAAVGPRSIEVSSAAQLGTILTMRQQLILGFSCGGVAGMVSRAVVHPLDTLRVLQSVSSPNPSAELLKGTQGEVPLLQRLSVASDHWMQTASRALGDGRRILRTATFNWHQLGGLESNPVYDTLQLRKGVAILYRGYGVSVFGAQPVFGAYFAAYEVAKLKVNAAMPDKWKGSSLVQLSAGFMAECVAAIVWNPWEVVRQRLQIAAGGPRTFVEAAMDIVAESGVRGLYSGIGSYMALWGCYSPLMFVIYEQGVALVGKQDQGGAPLPPSIATSFLVGSFAGAVAAVVTSPLDVVKTRIQIQTPSSMTRYSGMIHGLSEVWRHEGRKALFQGTAARAANMGLSAGIMLSCYATLRNHVAVRAGWAPPEPEQVASSVGAKPRARLQSWYTSEPQIGLFAINEGADYRRRGHAR